MELTIKLSTLNELMGENKYKYFVEAKKGHQGIPDGDYDGRQGEHNEEFRIYKHHDLPEGILMKETYITDSYGDNESLQSVQFVKGIEKTLKTYEII